MINKARKWLEKFKNREDFPFFIVSVLYFILFMFIPEFGDDATLREQYINLTLTDHWNLIMQDYYTWSSRVLVNFIFRLMLQWNMIIWLILNTILIFVLQKSLSKLFVKSNRAECNIIIAFFVMMFPVEIVGSAGWITTTATYLWTVVVGFVSLIPIRKILDEEKFKWWEYIIYSISLIYAANEEMELVVILFCYIVFGVYCIYLKRFKKYILLQNILAFGSLLFTLTAPGNVSRGNAETVRFFQDYQMLSFIDKIEMGFTSTMYNIIFGNYTFFIVSCFLIVLLVWKKYTNIVCRGVAIIPFVSVLGVGAFKDIMQILFNYVSFPSRGLITVESCTSIRTFIQFFFLCIVAISFVLSIYLILENSFQTIFSLTLLVSGTASRIAMGFSPTIWASGERTFTVLLFSLMGIGVILYTECVNGNFLQEEERKYIKYIGCIAAVFSYIWNCLTIM